MTKDKQETTGLIAHGQFVKRNKQVSTHCHAVTVTVEMVDEFIEVFF